MVSVKKVKGENVEDIIIALEKIKVKGSFCGKQTVAVDKLQLEFKKFGMLKLPLSARDAKALTKLSKPAKYGLRDKTLLDKRVRDAWEISKSNIKIDKSWQKELDLILEHFKKDLGLPENATLKASLHNFLIYGSGQFFSPHQDSEKADGMVASLVVVLPSSHSGGSLVIDHQGVKKQFHTARFPLDKLSLIAFYADCHHEVKAVKEGYRAALTYNLILENNSKKTERVRSENDCSDITDSLRAYFSARDKKNETSNHRCSAPKKWVYLLDHSYTQKGLSWSHLKNGDNLRADALKSAAKALDLEIYLALAEVKEISDCEEDYGNVRYRSNRQFYTDEDEYNENEVETGELIDSETTLSSWVDGAGKSLKIKECHVSDSELCWTKASNEFEPFDSDYEGYMGNYGNTMDRWYHRAAIILWPQKDHDSVLFDIDANSVISGLYKLTKKKSQETRIRQIITSLSPYWPEQVRRNCESNVQDAIFNLAIYINDSQLAQVMLGCFGMQVITPARIPLLMSLQRAYGTSWLLTLLEAWAKPESQWSKTDKCKQLSQLVKKITLKNDDHKQITDWLLNYQFQTIQKYDVSNKENDSRIQLLERNPERFSEVIDFIKACIFVKSHAIYLEAVNYVMSNPALYAPLELVGVLDCIVGNLPRSDLKQWQYTMIRDYILNSLKAEHSAGVRQKNDWSIKERTVCKCQDCDFLAEFLESSKLKSIAWPLSKDRRSHIHRGIDGLGISVMHKTERTGSPHKLILTKTEDLFRHSKKRFEKIESVLRLLSESENLL